VSFFNEFGFDFSYPPGGGFPSRHVFTEARLDEANGTDRLTAVIEAAVDPINYVDTQFPVEAAVAHLNKYLRFDGLELSLAGERYRLRRIGETLVLVEKDLTSSPCASHEFIAEQISKCDRKLR
jgi:hypothetical protein